MTIEQRLEQLELQNQRIEQQNQRIERKNKRLTVALTLMAVAICAVVTVAATGDKRSEFGTVVADTVAARSIYVTNEAGKIVMNLGVNDIGGGSFSLYSAEGKRMIELNTTGSGNEGKVTTYQSNGKILVDIGVTAAGNGGLVDVYNILGESIAQIFADVYGNGVVGAFNRKGMGRELKPGP